MKKMYVTGVFWFCVGVGGGPRLFLRNTGPSPGETCVSDMFRLPVVLRVCADSILIAT